MSKSKVSHKNSEVYQKVISYLMRTPDSLSRVDEKWFLIDLYRCVYKGLKTLQEKDIKFTLDEMFFYAKEHASEIIPPVKIEYQDIETIYNNFSDFSNIDILIRRIRDDYLKSVETAHILEDLLTQYTTLDNIPIEELKKIRERIDETVHTIEQDDNLPTVPHVMEEYLGIVENRGKEEKKRTLGYPILDKHLPKAGKGGQMMLIFGESGSGKSLFVQSMVNQMLNVAGQKIPIAYFSLEMPLETVMDRFISMRSGLSLEELDRINTDERVRLVFERTKSRLEAMDNLLIFTPSSLSLDNLDGTLAQADEYWKEKGILPEDKYKVVILDLVTMLSDFGDLTPQKIEAVVNRLHVLIKKHNAFLIAVAQANENELRSEGRFKKPEQVMHYKLRKQSIKNGSALYERSRTVVALLRRRELLKMYFSEDVELWETMPDLIDFDVIKNNEGGSCFLKFSFQVDPYKILPYIPPSDTEDGEHKEEKPRIRRGR